MAPPKQKAPKGRAAKPQKSISDPRFANIETDPRFRLPSKKNKQVKLDKRFARVLKDEEFSKKASVDRYGRKVDKNAGKKELERFYRLEDEDKDEEQTSASGSEADSESDEADDDTSVQKELARVNRKYDPAREGGFSSSSEDESSEDEAEAEAEEDEQALPEETDVPMGEITSRIAAVNLDWDNIRAVDLMVVANSFVPADGRILNVTVYPSEFGKERIAKEEVEGPPKEIFGASNGGEGDNGSESGSDSDSEAERDKYKKQLLKENKGEEFDSAALRAYQLDRLRYYYAVFTCSSPQTAKALYDDMDGREYLSSANFFDLRFIPDEVSFDDDVPRDSCDKVPDGYKPNEFTTDALTHSKVKLTWDADDTTRKETQKRAFSRAEMDENDLLAYIGSEESSEEEDDARAAKLRAALGLSTENGAKSKKKGADAAPVGDMQITFTPGLSSKGDEKKGAVFEEEGREETTIEKYIRKEKERKAKKKERLQARREGRDPDADKEEDKEEALTSGSDDDFEGFADSAGEKSEEGDEDEDDDPFNDPFFQDPEAVNREAKKQAKAKKAEEARKAKEMDASKRAELELLMLDEETGARNLNHFDMNAILKAEKDKNRKKKKKAKKGDNEQDQKAGLQEDFHVDVKDPRFARLYESHEFAIDPTNPRYKPTEGMKALLEEGRRRRKEVGSKRGLDDGVEEEVSRKKKRKGTDEAKSMDGDELKKLMERVKGRATK